jgi:hypothetical protein
MKGQRSARLPRSRREAEQLASAAKHGWARTGSAELELASLDELLPRADRLPLPRLGFAPTSLPGRESP